MAEKQCPDCKMMIDKEAKICPHCRKRQGTSTGVIILTIIFVLIGVGMCQNLTSNKGTEQSYKVPEIQLTENGKKIKLKHPAWSNVICNTVAKKEIQIGMTTEQVIAGWGKPERNNESVGAWGTHEQWIYGNTYVYFENGIMTSWQDSK